MRLENRTSFRLIALFGALYIIINYCHNRSLSFLFSFIFSGYRCASYTDRFLGCISFCLSVATSFEINDIILKAISIHNNQAVDEFWGDVFYR